MAVVILPNDPPPAAMSIGKVSAANVLSPAFSGADAELDRKGERYALTYLMPSMSYLESMPFSVLSQRGITVVMDVHQPGFSPGPVGAPRIKGAAQSGSNLLIDGLTPGTIIRVGQFLSIIVAGQRFLHRAAAPVVANAGGEATVALQEMLRYPPNDNDVVEIAAPKIEGYVRDLGEWTVGIDHEVGIRFTIRERE